jgi:NhaP-type Na+/H+ and K+/H+ antiporter
MLQSQLTRVAPLLRRSVARLTAWVGLSTAILTVLMVFPISKELAVLMAILAFALAEQPVRSIVLQGLLAEPKPRLIRLDPEELLNYLLELAQEEQVRRGIPEDDAASPDHSGYPE